MYTNNISEYLALIKKRGLAVNNLYMVEISLPTALMSFGAKMYMTGYTVQNDQNMNIDNNNILSGIVDVNKYKTGAKNIAKSLGFGGEGGSSFTDKRRTRYDATEKACILCVGGEMPFYKQKIGNSFYNHITHKTVIGLDTDPITLTFYVDRDNIVLTMFDAWQNLINNSENGEAMEGMLSYKNEYAANEFTVSLINRTYDDPRNTQQAKLEKFYSTSLIGAFPSYIRPLNINNGTTELLQLQVMFEFDRIRHKTHELKSQDPAFQPEIATGFNLLDMKNKAGDAISQGRQMINNVRNDVKSATSNVNDIKKSVTNLFK